MIDVKKLALMAQEKGICNEGFTRILASGNLDALMEYYLEGIDFCLEKEFPSLEYLAQHKDVVSKHGVHINAEVIGMNAKKAVLLGKCNAKMTYSGYTVSELFIKHDTVASITTRDNAFLVVDIFDNARLELIVNDMSKVIVNTYGDSQVKTKGEGHVKIVKKRSASYV